MKTFHHFSGTITLILFERYFFSFWTCAYVCSNVFQVCSSADTDDFQFVVCEMTANKCVLPTAAYAVGILQALNFSDYQMAQSLGISDIAFAAENSCSMDDSLFHISKSNITYAKIFVVQFFVITQCAFGPGCAISRSISYFEKSCFFSFKRRLFKQLSFRLVIKKYLVPGSSPQLDCSLYQCFH